MDVCKITASVNSCQTSESCVTNIAVLARDLVPCACALDAQHYSCTSLLTDHWWADNFGNWTVNVHYIIVKTSTWLSQYETEIVKYFVWNAWKGCSNFRLKLISWPCDKITFRSKKFITVWIWARLMAKESLYSPKYKGSLGVYPCLTFRG